LSNTEINKEKEIEGIKRDKAQSSRRDKEEKSDGKRENTGRK